MCGLRLQPNNDVQICIPEEESWSPLGEELTDEEVLFLELVDTCDLQGVRQLLAENRVNINIKNYEGITPLHLAIKNNCEPMVDLILHQKGEYHSIVNIPVVLLGRKKWCEGKDWFEKKHPGVVVGAVAHIECFFSWRVVQMIIS